MGHPSQHTMYIIHISDTYVLHIMYVATRLHVEIYLDRFDLGDDLFKVGVVGFENKLQLCMIGHLPLGTE